MWMGVPTLFKWRWKWDFHKRTRNRLDKNSRLSWVSSTTVCLGCQSSRPSENNGGSTSRHGGEGGGEGDWEGED